MRLPRVLVVLAALTLAGAAAATAQDSAATAARPRASRTPHRTINKEDCLSCHRQGNPEHISPVPAEHDYTNDRCMRCHRAATTMPSQSRHPFDDDHARCTECHVAGNTVEAQPVPANHDGRTGAQCVMCHEPQSAPN